MKMIGKVLLAAALAAGPLVAAAQDPTWPAKPIRIIVPYPAGGAVEVMVRALSTKLAGELGQPVVVEAKPGGNSNIGADTVANAPPDGYTLLASGPWFIINQLIETGRRWKPSDFMPIARFAVSPNYMVVGATSAARTVSDYVEMAKKSPGMLYGSTGVGSTQDMAVEMFKNAAGIKLDPVLYKGAPPIIPDLVSGQVSMAIVAGGNATAQIDAGRLRALASTGSRRSATTPDVPTMGEAGYPNVEVISWYGLHAPAGTSASVAKKLDDAVKAAATDSEVMKRITTANGEEGYQNAADFDQYLKSEFTRWEKVVAGLTRK